VKATPLDGFSELSQGRPLAAIASLRTAEHLRRNRHRHPQYMTLHWRTHSEQHMTQSAARFGFVEFAETWNGRLAMLGFVIGLGTELLTGQSILSQIGLG
jgi:hypothetical protein